MLREVTHHNMQSCNSKSLVTICRYSASPYKQPTIRYVSIDFTSWGHLLKFTPQVLIKIAGIFLLCRKI